MGAKIKVRFKGDDADKKRGGGTGEDKLIAEFKGDADRNTITFTGDNKPDIGTNDDQFEVFFGGRADDNTVVITDLGFDQGDILVFRNASANLVGRGAEGGVSNGQIKSLAQLTAVANFLQGDGDDDTSAVKDGDDLVLNVGDGNRVVLQGLADDVTFRGGEDRSYFDTVDTHDETKVYAKRGVPEGDYEFADNVGDDGVKEALIRDFDLADGDWINLKGDRDVGSSGKVADYATLEQGQRKLAALLNEDDAAEVTLVDADGDGVANDIYIRTDRGYDVVLQDIDGENVGEYNGLTFDDGTWLA